ncbi:alpha/beta hydrolase [Agromyces bauzanensis]|uniref:Esterase n=1 Tax=Agromyces bauzanensis TaxID=1308924 RepID=A0A917PNH0_9MICO|nr:alpha/beta hydrolase [Agromyces bauzanensis]GGJ85381.1 esterase [Agromyces bauzanensis]
MTAVKDSAVKESAVKESALRDLYLDWSNLMATKELDTRLFRSIFDEWHQPTVEPEGVTYKEEVVGGVPGIWALPIGADADKVVVFTHGGGFAVGSASSHRKLAGHLAKAAGWTAFVADYRRAPEHPHPAQVEDGVSVVRALLDRGIKPEHIATAGDSAGGNLAVAIPLALRENGLPLPGHVIAFSPWLDMENKLESLETNDLTDALISTPLLEGMIAGVLGDSVSPTAPLANPLYADFKGYPPLYITAGSVESLVDNAKHLAEKAKAAGVDVTLNIAEGQQHVYPFLAGRDPEVDAELVTIGKWLNA